VLPARIRVLAVAVGGYHGSGNGPAPTGRARAGGGGSEQEKGRRKKGDGGGRQRRAELDGFHAGDRKSASAASASGRARPVAVLYAAVHSVAAALRRGAPL